MRRNGATWTGYGADAIVDDLRSCWVTKCAPPTSHMNRTLRFLNNCIDYNVNEMHWSESDCYIGYEIIHV